MILRLEVHIDTADNGLFNIYEEAIVTLLEAAFSMVTVQTVVTVPDEDRTISGLIIRGPSLTEEQP